MSSRAMAPWGVDNTGACQTFQNARWLSDAEIDTISQWANGGAPEGTTGQASAPGDSAASHTGHLATSHAPLTALTGDVVEMGMATSFVPAPTQASPADEYRCFMLDPDLPADRFVTGFEVLPGNPALVHHVLLFSVDPEQVVGLGTDGKPVTNAKVMAQLQAADGARGGWSCFGVAGEGVVVNGLPVTWAPGTGATHYPTGTGLMLRKGHKLVMQVHYHLLGGAGIYSDQTRVKLEVAAQVARPAFVGLPDGLIPPGYGAEDEMCLFGVYLVPVF